MDGRVRLAGRILLQVRGLWLLPSLALSALGLWRDEGPQNLQPPLISGVVGWLPAWAWAIAALLILWFLTLEGAYRLVRTPLGDVSDELGDTIARMRRVEFAIGKQRRDAASILHDLARDFARGLSSLNIERVFRERLDTKSQNLPLADILAELRLARVVREEHRQAGLADASGIFQSFWTGPYTMYYLTDWGARIVARLRDEAN